MRIYNFKPINFFKIYCVSRKDCKLIFKSSCRNNCIGQFCFIGFTQFNRFICYIFRQFINFRQIYKTVNILTSRIMTQNFNFIND